MPQQELDPLREKQRFLVNLSRAGHQEEDSYQEEDPHQVQEEDHHQVQEDEQGQSGKFAYLPVSLQPVQCEGVLRNTKTKCYIISPDVKRCKISVI